jgi:S-adenosylmethionine:diacylglycerol 3-amino-3-carboxypropyl transferase
VSTPAPVADTPWDRGRFDTRAGPQHLLFGHMYEDAAVESRAFTAGGRIFCIASAGDTALALAERHPVVAVDINPVQLAYARARLAGAPAETGTAERLMAFGRSLLPLAGWRRASVEEFLALDSTTEQLAFWHAHLNTRRFRTGVDLLLSLSGLRHVYASPFLQVLPQGFGKVMRMRMERCFAHHPNAKNPYARALLLGEFPPAPRPRQPVELLRADAAGYLESATPGSFDGFTLSNVLDGAPATYRARLLAAVQRTATREARLVLRSFAEPRHSSSTNLAAEDRSMLWGSVTATETQSMA